MIKILLKTNKSQTHMYEKTVYMHPDKTAPSLQKLTWVCYVCMLAEN